MIGYFEWVYLGLSWVFPIVLFFGCFIGFALCFWAGIQFMFEGHNRKDQLTGIGIFCFGWLLLSYLFYMAVVTL